MARLSKDGIQLLGTIQNLIYYKRDASDQIFVRRKGHFSKTKYKKGANYDLPRRNNAEFGGRATTSGLINTIFKPLSHVADHSLTGELNRLLKPAQLLDTVSILGQRNVLLSRNPQMLEGFTFNKKFLLETVIRQGLPCTIDKAAMKARIEIPALVPGKNFYMPKNYDWYRITAVLGAIPDHLYAEPTYMPAMFFDYPYYVNGNTDWYTAKKGSGAVALELQMPAVRTPTDFSLIVVAGISFGKATDVDQVDAVKHVGAAKIIGMR